MRRGRPGAVEDTPRLRELRLLRDRVDDARTYPFTVPAIAAFDRLELDRRVTFFVGENGSGKSTLLEAVALASGFGPEGGTRNHRGRTTEHASDAQPLADALRLSWTRKLTRGRSWRFRMATRGRLRSIPPDAYERAAADAVLNDLHIFGLALASDRRVCSDDMDAPRRLRSFRHAFPGTPRRGPVHWVSSDAAPTWIAAMCPDDPSLRLDASSHAADGDEVPP